MASALGAAFTVMPLYTLPKRPWKKWPAKGFQRLRSSISSAKGSCCYFPFPYQHLLFLFLSPQGMAMSPLPFNLTQPQSSPAQTSRALTALVTSSRRKSQALKDDMWLMALQTYFWGSQHFHSMALPTAAITRQYYCKQTLHITSLGEVPNLWSPLRTIMLHRTTLKSRLTHHTCSSD